MVKNIKSRVAMQWFLILIVWGVISEISFSDTIRVFFASKTPQHEFAAGDIKTALEAKGFTVEFKELSALSDKFQSEPQRVRHALSFDTRALRG